MGLVMAARAASKPPASYISAFASSANPLLSSQLLFHFKTHAARVPKVSLWLLIFCERSEYTIISFVVVIWKARTYFTAHHKPTNKDED